MTVADPSTLIATEPAPPPLEPGDHLSREEFERRYDAMPGLKKAELLEGIVYMASPVRWNRHARPHVAVLNWLGSYEARTPGVQVGDNASIRLAGPTMPQPDAVMIIEPGRRGRATLSEDDYIEGAPELIVEVAASTASIDLNTKLRVYRQNGVPEYVVWRVLDSAIDWFILRQSQYDRLRPGSDGIYRSEVFPGLWLDPAALTAFDLARTEDVVRLGIASPEHAAFLARLVA